MASRYYPGLALAIAIVVGVGVLMQLAIPPTAAQHGGKVKVTGRITDKLLKHFESSAGLARVRNIELRRLTMAPGATMEGNMVFDDHTELCVVEKGSVTFTMADGSTRTFKEGDIYITPLGAKQKRMVADPNHGYQELVWVITVKGRH